MSVDADERVADAQVDVGEMIDRERVSDIQESKQNVRDSIETVELALSDGIISEKEGNLRVARVVGLHIRELKYPLKKADKGEPYWEEKVVGTWEIPKPNLAEMAWRHKLQNNIGQIPPENRRTYSRLPSDYELINEAEFQTKEIEIRGLRQYLNMDWQATFTHTAEFSVRFGGDYTAVSAVRKTIPRRVSMEAYSLCNEFLGELGLGLDVDAGRPFANYSKE